MNLWAGVVSLLLVLLSFSPTTSPLPTSTRPELSTPSTLSLHDGHLLRPYLPAEWDSFCDVLYDVDRDVNATISCQVTAHNPVLWRLADLRSALNETVVASLRLQVAVEIECDDGGTISLPFPFRAPGLVKLTVVHCRLLDKWADFKTPAENLRDWLQVEDIQDCVWLNDPKQSQTLLDNLQTISSHYGCGQDSSMVTCINRNISYVTADPMESCMRAGVYIPAMQALNLTYPTDLGLLLDSVELFEKFLNYSRERGALAEECALAMEPWRSIYLKREDFMTVSGAETSTKGSAKSSTEDPNKDVLETFVQLDKAILQCRFEKLQVYDMSNSRLLSKEFFPNMVLKSEYPQLQILNFSRVGLTEVPKEIREWRRFFDNSKLHTIDLSHNFITEVGDIRPYYNKVNVSTTLNVQFNRLSKLSLNTLQDWAQVSDFRVDFRNNPLDCACDLKDILIQLNSESMWTASQSAIMMDYRGQMLDLTCASPVELTGRPLRSLTVDDLSCTTVERDNIHLIVGMVVLAVLVVLLLLLLLLAIKYWTEVRILMYTRVHILLPCGMPKPSSGPSLEKTYDAFVAYAHQDSDWVLGSLLKRLEEPGVSPKGRQSCKLCIHQRDFVVGKPIIDNIVDSIAASRHTIVILSNSFVRSGWAMEELQQAYAQSVEERRRHLVVVMLEKVDHSYMDPVLRRCCKTFPYLRVSDSLFWDRLLYSIQIGDHKKISSKNRTLSLQVSCTEENIMHKNRSDSSAQKITDKGHNHGVEFEEPIGIVDSDFNKMALFSETLRSVSVDSSWSTASVETQCVTLE